LINELKLEKATAVGTAVTRVEQQEKMDEIFLKCNNEHYPYINDLIKQLKNEEERISEYTELYDYHLDIQSRLKVKRELLVNLYDYMFDNGTDLYMVLLYGGDNNSLYNEILYKIPENIIELTDELTTDIWEVIGNVTVSDSQEESIKGKIECIKSMMRFQTLANVFSEHTKR
jgi:hypothetical protein